MTHICMDNFMHMFTYTHSEREKGGEIFKEISEDMVFVGCL